MIWLSRILTFFVGFAALWFVVFLVVTTYGWEKVWISIHGNPDLGPIEFQGFAKTGKPNQALICPEDLCSSQGRNDVSPVYNLPPEGLRQEFEKSLAKETSLTRVDDGSNPAKMRFVQRSRLLRFPDTVRVEFLPVEDGTKSTLALHSQSQVGHNDFRVNIKRLRRWLGRLKQFEQ